MIHPLGEIDKAWKECLDVVTTKRREMRISKDSWSQYAGRLRSLAVCAKHYAEAIEEYLQETALVWEKLTDDRYIDDNEPTYGWEEATSGKIAKLNVTKCCGHSDWRLPTIEELVAAVADYGVSRFAREAGSFGYLACYWSSSTHADYPTRAWFVDSSDGVTYYADKTNSFSVWAVRGGA